MQDINQRIYDIAEEKADDDAAELAAFVHRIENSDSDISPYTYREQLSHKHGLEYSSLVKERSMGKATNRTRTGLTPVKAES